MFIKQGGEITCIPIFCGKEKLAKINEIEETAYDWRTLVQVRRTIALKPC